MTVIGRLLHLFDSPHFVAVNTADFQEKAFVSR